MEKYFQLILFNSIHGKPSRASQVFTYARELVLFVELAVPSPFLTPSSSPALFSPFSYLNKSKLYFFEKLKLRFGCLWGLLRARFLRREIDLVLVHRPSQCSFVEISAQGRFKRVEIERIWWKRKSRFLFWKT